MGVDLTLFVVADYSRSDLAFACASFDLDRWSPVWAVLREIPSMPLGCPMQVPQGSWSTFADGTSPETNGREMGYLSEDEYGAPLRWIVGRQFPDLEVASDLTRAIFKLLREHYPDHRVVLFWH